MATHVHYFLAINYYRLVTVAPNWYEATVLHNQKCKVWVHPYNSIWIFGHSVKIFFLSSIDVLIPLHVKTMGYLMFW